MASRELPVISLFSGALGLDQGLEQAGFRLRVAVECNRFAAETIRHNRPDVALIQQRIEDVSTRAILAAARLKPGEPAVVTAGPSCQAFSTAGQRASMGDPRGVMFREFVRVVREAQPRFFVMENVRGVLSAAIRHRPLGKRGPGHPRLARREELGSAFVLILRELRRTGYHVVFDVVNAADFGVPSMRERLVFIGSRDGEPLEMPVTTHAKDASKGRRAWVTLRKAIGELHDPKPACIALPPSKTRYLKRIPEGGNWKHLPRRLQARALGAAYKSWGGRSGFLRRLAWDRPAPALTTRPDSSATLLCHPTELRALSVREYAVIQQFPKRWKLAGGTPQQYKQLGNAVPVGLGKAIGLAIRETMQAGRRYARRATVVCYNEDLLERIAKRPHTVLNPTRMRKVKTLRAARRWLSGRNRGHVVKLVARNDDAAQNKRRRATG